MGILKIKKDLSILPRQLQPFLPLKATSTQISSKVLEDKKDQAIIQVLIMYSSSFCAHTALRL